MASQGLDTHENLRYLLLENNQLRRLPCELANLRNLTALNLDNNPLERPPCDVVAKGLKSILDFLRGDYAAVAKKSSTGDQTTVNNSNYVYYYDDSLATDDVWASDTEDTSHEATRVIDSMSKSASNLNNSV